MEIPPCPRPGHEKSVVVRAGWYGRQGQRRQRWKCTPGTGEVHRFAEVLPRIVSGAAEHVCAGLRDLAGALGGSARAAVVRVFRARCRGGVGDGRRWGVVSADRGGDPGPGGAAVGGCSAAEPVEEEGPQGQRCSSPRTGIRSWSRTGWRSFAPIIWAAYGAGVVAGSVAIDECEFRYSQPGKPRWWTGGPQWCAAVPDHPSGASLQAAQQPFPGGDVAAGDRFDHRHVWPPSGFVADRGEHRERPVPTRLARLAVAELALVDGHRCRPDPRRRRRPR